MTESRIPSSATSPLSSSPMLSSPPPSISSHLLSDASEPSSHFPSLRSSPSSVRQGRPILNRPLRRRRPRLSNKAKLDLTLRFWKQNNISLDDFLGAWVLDREAGGSYSLNRRVASVKRILQKPDIADVIGFPRATSASSDAVFHSEFKALIERPLFNRFDTLEMTGKLDDIDFSQARREISLHAPNWAELLSGLLQNSRAGWASYDQAKTIQDGPFYAITAMICRARARTRSDFFAKSMGLYLLGNNVKRRVIEVISGLGVCDTYKVINREFNRIAKHTESQ
jgi:hypothetical protein